MLNFYEEDRFCVMWFLLQPKRKEPVAKDFAKCHCNNLSSHKILQKKKKEIVEST